MDMIPIVVEFRQSAQLCRIFFEKYAEKQIPLLRKAFPIKIAEQLIHIGILLFKQIRRFITVNDTAVCHFPKRFTIFFHNSSENNMFSFQIRNLIKQFFHFPPLSR